MVCQLTICYVMLRVCSVEEVDNYNTSDSSADVLSYCYRKEEAWPRLTQCAKRVLSILATSMSSDNNNNNKQICIAP